MNEDNLTTEQMQAVINFARRHGRFWKEILTERWWHGTYSREDDIPRLQQVRNQFGPEWLNKQPEEFPL